MTAKFRTNRAATNLLVEKLEDPWVPGQVVLTLSYRTEKRSNTYVDRVVARVDTHQLIRLVEQARPILDAQIARLQAQRGRLG